MFAVVLDTSFINSVENLPAAAFGAITSNLNVLIVSDLRYHILQ